MDQQHPGGGCNRKDGSGRSTGRRLTRQPANSSGAAHLKWNCGTRRLVDAGGVYHHRVIILLGPGARSTPCRGASGTSTTNPGCNRCSAKPEDEDLPTSRFTPTSGRGGGSDGVDSHNHTACSLKSTGRHCKEMHRSRCTRASVPCEALHCGGGCDGQRWRQLDVFDLRVFSALRQQLRPRSRYPGTCIGQPNVLVRDGLGTARCCCLHCHGNKPA